MFYDDPALNCGLAVSRHGRWSWRILFVWGSPLMCTFLCTLMLLHTWVLTFMLHLHQILTVSFLFPFPLFLHSHLSSPDPLLHLPFCSRHLLFPSPKHCSTSPLRPSFSITNSPFLFSTSTLPVSPVIGSSSLQRGKAASPSPLQWPIESFWAPISLLIGWAGLSRYWEEGLALSVCLPVYLSVCMTSSVSAEGLISSLLQSWNIPTRGTSSYPNHVCTACSVLH